MKSLFNFIICLVLFFGLTSACFYIPVITAQSPSKEALFYGKLDGKKVQCQLCPRRCIIPDGKRGFCRIRENHSGILYTLVYAKPVSLHIEPIEKEPLFHFLPSTTAFSIATAGCNLRCKFCQNWQISQAKPEEVEYVYLEPEELVKKVLASGSPTISYTYSEPTIFYEYLFETAKIARLHGIKNAIHSSGFINEVPLRQLAKYLDAANIDLKGFNNDYYTRMAEGALEPVLRSLKILKDEGVYLEITNLVLPGFNDNPEEIKKMCLWIKDNLGSATPLHFSRFFPTYKMAGLNPTPVEALERAREIALASGLKYVYIGNIAGHSAENTYCPKCKKMLIERRGYFITQNNLEDGKCKFCGEKIEGIWK